jgi:enoyl-CoA hydratase
MVTTDTIGPIRVVTLDRRDARNAVDRPTAQALADAFRSFEADDSLSVAVLVGAHGTFCAGADLKAMADDARRNRLERDGDGPMGPSRMLLTKPVIAAVSGHAVAGGAELALWCDLRIFEASAVFGIFCRRFGVPLIDGGTVRLPRIVGLGRALDLILTGRAVGADEALAMGLVNRVVARGRAREAAEELAHTLAALPWRCLTSDRRATYDGLDLGERAAMAREFELGLATLRSGESVEGARRFAAGAGRHGGDGKR